MQAMGLAPGGERAFAMERWPLAADATVAPTTDRAARRGAGRRARARRDARGRPDRRLRPRRAHDRKRAPQRRSRRRLGPLTLACRDADAARPPAPTGLVITNPPYGHRLGDPRAAARGYRDLGRVLRAHFRGWRAAVVTPAKLDGERQLGIRATRTSARFPLRNGGLAIVLHVFDVA